MPYAMIVSRAGRTGLSLCLCIGIWVAPQKSWAQAPQIDTPAGAADAGRAYGEVEAKNYSGAIEDFQKALAANPSSTQWRKDLGYAYLAAGLPGDAALEFSRVYSESVADFPTALQLAYILQNLGRYEDARKYFEIVASKAGADLSIEARHALAEMQEGRFRDRKQLGYNLIAQRKNREAMQDFEALHSEDPSDVSVTLQLAYLYASAGRTRDAREMFTLAFKSADPKISSQANLGLEQIQRDSKLWFASIYAEPFYQSRFSNEINPVNAKIGLSPSPYFQPYLGLRFNRDVRSVAGSLPVIYSDNTATISIGVQSAIGHTGAVLYAEAGTAVNLIGQTPLAASDYRAGMVWSRDWGTGLFAAREGGRSVSPTGSAYFDGGFYTRYDRDFIANVQLREGIDLPILRAVPMQLLGATNFIKDSNGIFYNNVVEVGPVFRMAPSRHLPSLSFQVQYFRGFYDVHDPGNPYGPRYGDVRVLLIWSQSF